MKKRREMSPQESHWLQEASDPATAPNRLCELAKQDKTLRRVCASNPNLPTDWLVWLARWEWRAVLQNPVLPLLLLEDPGFPAKLPVKALREILKTPAPPAEFLSLLGRHSDPEIRESARLHRANFSADAADTPSALAPQVSVRGGAALLELLELELAPPWVLQEALEAAQGPLRTRAAKIVGRGNDFSDPLRKRLGLLHVAGASWDLSRISKSEHQMRPEQLELLSKGGPFARCLAACHPNTAPECLALLAEVHQEPRTRRAAASNPSTPLGTLVSLASTGTSDLRGAVARNPGASPALLEKLAGDAQVEVRRGVAARSTCPPGALARLARDADEAVRCHLARNPATDGATLEVLAKDTSKEVRGALAKRRGCPLEILRLLLGDEDWRVRHNAAGNNVLPGTARERQRRIYLREDKISPANIAAILETPPTPEETERERILTLLRENEVAPALWEAAARHPDNQIRERVAFDAQAPAELLAQMVGDSVKRVRLGLAHNTNLPHQARLVLWQDEDDEIRAATLRAGAMPLECFEEIARHPSEALRTQLTYAQHVPLAVLLRLAREDPSASVVESLCGSHRDKPVAEEVLLALIERHEEFPQLRQRLSGNSYLSREVLERLIPLMAWHERCSILSTQTYRMSSRYKPGPDPWPVPDDLLLQMRDLPEDIKYMRNHINQQILDYWTVSPAVIETITREILAENVANDKRRYYRRRRSNQGGLLRNIALHPRTPPAILAELTTNISHPVRLAALENPRTPPEARAARREAALLGTTKRSGQTNKLCGLAHPDTDPHVLRRFAQKGRWMERLAVARNGGAPRDLLQSLLDDTNIAVSSAAQASLDAQNATNPQ